MRIWRNAAKVSGALAGGLLAAACATTDQAATPEPAESEFTPVTDAMLLAPDPADWLMWRRTLDSWGYSPLDQINRRNVSRLALVWSRGLAEGASQEGTPLVHDGVMFFPSPNDVTDAFDAQTGDLLWEHRRRWPDDLKDYIPNPDINRNLAIHGGLIYDLSSDDFLYALDAKTGEQVWESMIVPYSDGGEQQSSGPITADGKVFSSRGCEMDAGPDPCVITAHDAETGAELWRTPTIARPGEPGDETWKGLPYEQRSHVGAWMVPSYDPELNRLYVGTSVTGPAPKYLLGGNDGTYLYHNSTLSLDADTGEIVWWFQHVVDNWDLDHTFERILVDTVVAPDPDAVRWINPNVTPGETRRVVTGIPGKTGIVYTLDRDTGEFLWATETIPQNVVADIDTTTGKSTISPDALFEKAGDRHTICPSGAGGKNWPAGAYSPQTNVMFMPLQISCARMTATSDTLEPGMFYGVANRVDITPPDEPVGVLQAISAETGETVWTYKQRATMHSVVATGGGLIFAGDGAGRFRAFDQRTGEVLWEVNLGSPVTGYPVTFAVDGRQYVAVSTGELSRANVLTPEIRVSASNTLFVFALP
jgi:PQQ-dependent dehydrogenase (methanol/ethanol family)